MLTVTPKCEYLTKEEWVIHLLLLALAIELWLLGFLRS